MDTHAATLAEPKVVARGLLDDMNTGAVLQALSISRQYTAVDFYTREGSSAGRVFLKSGMVLAARLPELGIEGLEALQQLMQKAPHSFQVVRLPASRTYPEPIGRLTTQLLTTPTAPHLRAAPEPTALEARPPVTATTEPTPYPPPMPANTRSLPRPRSAPVPVPVPDPPPASRPAVPLPRSGRQPTAPAPAHPPVIAVASPKGGCGKTTVALNLAVSLVGSGSRVLLVDADPNGDILSSVGARERAREGVFETFAKGIEPSNLILDTALEGLRILPAMGTDADIPDSLQGVAPDSGLWLDVLRHLQGSVDVIIVDTAAGMFGMTLQILRACSHVIGVLQAETISNRSFNMFDRVLRSAPDAPEVAGVVLNMFRRSHNASVSVLVDASADLPEAWLFQTTLPRSDLFLDATMQSVPLAYLEKGVTSGLTMLFDTLAAEVRDRVGMSQRDAPAKIESFVL